MPSIQTLKMIGGGIFASKMLKLPNSDWKKGSNSDHYGRAFQASDKIAIPSLIPPWFMPQEPNKYYQDSCDKIGNDFKDLHDTMIDAVAYSHQMWKLQCKFQNFQIMAVSAIGTPGCLDGPELESNIKNFPGCASWSGNKAKYRDAVAAGVSKCFKNWQGQVTCPGLPLYPAFAAFPGPMAPPMPNVPVPLIACISGMMSQIIVPMTLKSEMVNAFDGGLKQKDKDKQHEAVFEALGTVLAMAFLMWMPQQQMMLNMGKGPIPTFAPPFVPVGPVMAGDNVGAPGHVMA